MRLFGYPSRTAILTGLGLTQIGEFSYVLVQVARQERLLGNDVYNAVLAASLVTILLNAVLFGRVPLWFDRQRASVRSTRTRKKAFRLKT